MLKENVVWWPVELTKESPSMRLWVRQCDGTLSNPESYPSQQKFVVGLVEL